MKANPTRLSKTHRGENFPVASWLIRAKHRPLILAFYRFARAADDVADDPSLAPAQKIERLGAMEASLLDAHSGEGEPHAAALRVALRARGMAPRHPLDLLKAFRLDAVKSRYVGVDDLMDYCALSAMPVGRFVLDVHGESATTWAASDSICAALQIINHLQDCREDYLELGRVYIPLNILKKHGVDVEALGAPAATASLLNGVDELADFGVELLRRGRGLASEVSDARLRLEIAVIEALATRLARRLLERDPLSANVHLNAFEALGTSALALARTLIGGFGLSRRATTQGSPT